MRHRVGFAGPLAFSLALHAAVLLGIPGAFAPPQARPGTPGERGTERVVSAEWTPPSTPAPPALRLTSHLLPPLEPEPPRLPEPALSEDAPRAETPVAPFAEPLPERLALAEHLAFRGVASAAESVVAPPLAAAAPPTSTAPPESAAEDAPATPPVAESLPGDLPRPLPAAENPAPEYPALARRRGWEGRVRLAVEVDAEGKVTALEVVASSGHPLLDRAARDAVLRWRFTPARRLGLAVAASTEVSVRFALLGDEPARPGSR